MKLKDLLAESRFDMEGPECAGCEDPSCACKDAAPDTETWGSDVGREEDELGDGPGEESCPGCGRGPGDGYGTDCEDPQGCGYWKDWAKDAVAELKRDMKADGAMDEATYFDRYMTETLAVEERRAKQLAAPVMVEGYGKIRQKRTQELPSNRTRIGRK